MSTQMQAVLSTAVHIVLALALGYLLLAAMLYGFQARLLYLPDLPSRQVDTSPSLLGLDYETVLLTTEDGETLYGWYIPAVAARGTLLFFHGNAGNISHRLDSIRQFNRLGLSVFIVDYRGYGQSSGSPSEKGTLLDSRAAWNHLVSERGIAPATIVVFGRSLGGSVAAALAAEVHAGALIVESTFTSVPDMAAQLYPLLPARWLSRYRYDARVALNQVRVPVLIVHSRDDEIIPFEHGQRLYQAARAPKMFLELRGDHNGGFLVSESTYLKGLDAFLREHFDPGAGAGRGQPAAQEV